MGGVLLLSACVKEPVATEFETGSRTVRLTLQGEITPFDALSGTKAAEALSWNAYDRIYVRSESVSGSHFGIATYGEDGTWSFTYAGSLRGIENVQCYFFQNAESQSRYDVSLTYNSVIYEDLDAKLIVNEDGDVTLSAYLKPKTGRICFGKNLEPGTSKMVTRITGISYYSSFNLKDFTFTSISSGLEQYYVSPDSYFYGFFTDPEIPSMTIRNAGIEFTRTFGDNVLQKGHSGYLNIPTYASHENWEMLNFQNVETMDFTVNGVTFRMVAVPGGSFEMGGVGSSYQVTLNDYLLGTTEVTQELWQAVMGTNPSAYTGEANMPVENVSWYDCQGFLYRLNALTGRQFRLPTEAEWEYAARGAGADSYTFSGGDDLSILAWNNDNSNWRTHPVATKTPNSLGIFDMSGNVWEWCDDWFGDYTYGSSIENPRGPKTGSGRTRRGGAYDCYSECVVTNRAQETSPSLRECNQGLRLAVSSVSDPAPEMIDLGLSVKWALNNIGAWCSEDSGDYFSWGEPFPKGLYYIGNYLWNQEGYSGIEGYNKYTFPDGQKSGIWYDGDTFVGDNKRQLDLADDAAWVLLGPPWRTPTKAEWEELIQNSSTSWDYKDNVLGTYVTGPNGNSIFLPASGFIDSDCLYDSQTVGHYVSATLGNYVNYAVSIDLSGGTISMQNSSSRTYGQTIRAVYDPEMLNVLTVSAKSLDAGRVRIGRSSTVRFTVRNNTRETVFFTIENLPESFSCSPAGTVEVGPGLLQQVELTFAPTAAGMTERQVYVSSSSLVEPLAISLTGYCVEGAANLDLPSKSFMFNYNAKEYNSSTITFPRTEGQLFDEDLILNTAPSSYESDNVYFGLSGAYMGKDYSSAADNPFNRSSSNTTFTFVYKTSDFTSSDTNIFANRSGNYNYMVRGNMFHTSQSGFLSLTPDMNPQIVVVRVYEDGSAERKVIDSEGSVLQTVSASSISWGEASEGIAFFAGYAYYGSELFQDRFYWMYCSLETLTDTEIQQVIDYNEL